MILIDDVEILTVGDGVSWNGAKDIVSRTLDFTILYVPEDKNFPRYNVKVGSKVKWVEDNKVLFSGYVQSLNYSTDGETLTVSCADLMIRLLKSKCIGRFQGTLNQLCNKICGLFGLQNGVNVDNTHVHNIVSDGDLSYYDVLNTACKSMFDKYCLYLEDNTLKLADKDIKATFEIGRNIRTSKFEADLSDIVTKVLIIDNEGHLLDSVQDDNGLQQFGLFQEVYNYNKDSKNNIAEAKKLLQSAKNTATIVVDNDNTCVSGMYIKVIEPINNYIGVFEITSDSHNIGADSNMTLEIENV